MSKRKTLNDWQNESNEIHNNEFELLQEPINTNDKIKILHKKCEKIFISTPRNHLKRYCSFCSNKHRRTKEEYQNDSNIIHNNKFKILGNPHNIKEKVKIKHLSCNNTYFVTMNNHLNKKNGCPYCNGNNKKDTEYWKSKTIEIWGTDYEILENINNVHHKIKIKHNLCGDIILKNMNSLINNKGGCEKCSQKSYGEIYVEKALNELSIKYIRQKTFNELLNIKTNRKLRIDFWLPEYNIGIEINGVQHYKSIKHWGGDDAFKSQVERDDIKKKYFIDKKYTLICVNNKEIKKIKDYLWEL